MSGSQQALLSSLDLVFFFLALDLLVIWLKEGRYDFCALPFAIKTHLTLEDSKVMGRIPESFQQKGRQQALPRASQFPSLIPLFLFLRYLEPAPSGVEGSQ